MTGAVVGSTIMDTCISGVVAGSTMREVFASQKKWGAPMINTGCNLECPRCYLGEKDGNATMSLETAQKLADYATKNWEGVVIIGTEPLLDERSIEVVNIFSLSVRTHLITNGINLNQFADRIKNVRRIDISLDGGPKTYQRGGNFQQILTGALKWKNLSGGKIYVLHVLSQENCKSENIEDMIAAGPLFDAERVVFSPYIQTIGGSTATPFPIKKIVESLRDFAGENWTLIIDPYHAFFERREWDKIKEDVSCLPQRNVLVVGFDH